jgi:NDP-sugar pyrophosphorylase family protein
MSNRAVVLAGGMGTRLRPYTVVFPKPLMPLGDYPILEVIVRQLAANGFNHITLAVNHQANLIKAFFGEGNSWNVAIDYSVESKPLSTIAPLCLIPDLPETFLLMNGDVLSDLSLRTLFQDHARSGAAFTIAAAERTQRIDYGVLTADANQRLIGFDEKPSKRYLVSMGVYVRLSGRSFEPCRRTRRSVSTILMHALIASGEHVQVRPHAGYWLDLGRPDDYAQAIEEFDRRKAEFLRDD